MKKPIKRNRIQEVVKPEPKAKTRLAKKKSKSKVDLILSEIETLFPTEVKPTVFEKPDFQYVLDTTEIPRKQVKLENVVHIDERLIRDIAKSIDTKTFRLNDKMLKRLVPLLLSYNASMSYVRAVMSEAFKIELDFEGGLTEAVKYTSYLAVITHFVKNSGMPKSVKKSYLDKVGDHIANETVKALLLGNKQAAQSSNMQAVIVKGRSSNMSSRPVEHDEPPKDTPPVGTMRRRSR